LYRDNDFNWIHEYLLSGYSVSTISITTTYFQLEGCPVQMGATSSEVLRAEMLERVWNGNSTLIDDTSAAKVAASVVSLSRDPGEAVASYNYKSGTLSALTGTSAGNYTASLDVTGKTLTIWPASALYGNFANLGAGIWQSVLYGNFANLGAGIWQWDATNWTQVTPNSPTEMVVSGWVLYGDFGNPNAGIWQWDGTNWTQVTPRLRLRRTLRPTW
jgi:hypothetical protein